jgi:hypothetical protein
LKFYSILPNTLHKVAASSTNAASIGAVVSRRTVAKAIK